MRKRLILVLSLFTAVMMLALLGFVYVFPKQPENPVPQTAEEAFVLPEYTGEPSAIMNGGRVYFEETHEESYTELQELDALGRCKEARSCIGPDTLTHEERGDIGMVKPSGWNLARYDDLIEDHYLFNRCHLLGYALTGLLADERNLITGTRCMNVMGMLPYEVEIARYVQRTENHVEYHVTPVFVNDELVCRGVLLQAKSVEDQGSGLQFCVFCFNVQPGVIIHYSDGTSERAEAPSRSMPQPELHYVINLRSGKFHYDDCDGVKTMSESNRKDVWCTRDDLIEEGYKPCGTCNP